MDWTCAFTAFVNPKQFMKIKLVKGVSFIEWNHKRHSNYMLRNITKLIFFSFHTTVMTDTPSFLKSSRWGMIFFSERQWFSRPYQMALSRIIILRYSWKQWFPHFRTIFFIVGSCDFRVSIMSGNCLRIQFLLICSILKKIYAYNYWYSSYWPWNKSQNVNGSRNSEWSDRHYVILVSKRKINSKKNNKRDK